jgi:hypothetical protein
LFVDSRCREALPRTCRGQDCGINPPTSMAASHKAWSDNRSVAARVQRRGRRSCKLTDRRRFGRSDTFGSPLRNGRLWANRRLQPKTAFLRLSPVHRTDLEGQQRWPLRPVRRPTDVWPLFAHWGRAVRRFCTAAIPQAGHRRKRDWILALKHCPGPVHRRPRREEPPHRPFMAHFERTVYFRASPKFPRVRRLPVSARGR